MLQGRLLFCQGLCWPRQIGNPRQGLGQQPESCQAQVEQAVPRPSTPDPTYWHFHCQLGKSSPPGQPLAVTGLAVGRSSGREAQVTGAARAPGSTRSYRAQFTLCFQGPDSDNPEVVGVAGLCRVLPGANPPCHPLQSCGSRWKVPS